MTRALAACALLGASGCLAWLPAPVPMAALRDAPPTPARCLLVLLPGVGDRASSFVRHGFVAAVRARHLPVDVVAADATPGYYARDQLLERLDADVVGPARARGAPQTWLVGLSLGGLGALLYAQVHPDAVSGVLALSPYLGDRALLDEIRADGGLARWSPAPAPQEDAPARRVRALWAWLQARARFGDGPALFLGYGTEDKLRDADALWAAALPEDRVRVEPGPHAWTTWKPLFEAFLDGPAFARACGADAPAR